MGLLGIKTIRSYGWTRNQRDDLLDTMTSVLGCVEDGLVWSHKIMVIAGASIAILINNSGTCRVPSAREMFDWMAVQPPVFEGGGKGCWLTVPVKDASMIQNNCELQDCDKD